MDSDILVKIKHTFLQSWDKKHFNTFQVQSETYWQSCFILRFYLSFEECEPLTLWLLLHWKWTISMEITVMVPHDVGALVVSVHAFKQKMLDNKGLVIFSLCSEQNASEGSWTCRVNRNQQILSDSQAHSSSATELLSCSLQVVLACWGAPDWLLTSAL